MSDKDLVITTTNVLNMYNDERTLVKEMMKCIINEKKLNINSNKHTFNYWWICLTNLFRQFEMLDVILNKENSKYVIEEDSKINNKIDKLSHTSIVEIEESKKIDIKINKNIIIKCRAAYTIMMQLLDELFAAVQHMHTNGDAYGLYTVLKDKFEPNTQVTSFKAQQMLHQVQMKSNETVNELINRINGLSNEIAKIPRGPDSEKLLALYHALPSQYQEVIRDKLHSDEKFTFGQATTLLLNEEDLRKLSKSNHYEANINKAFQAKFKNNDSSKLCDICEKTNHNTKECYYNSRNKKNNYNTPSNNAGSNKNKTFKSNENQASTTSTNYNKQFNGAANKKQVRFYANHLKYKNFIAKINKNSRENKAILFLDSGCSVHTCNNKNLLTNIKYISPIQVEVANGESIEVKQTGQLQLGPFINDNTKLTIVLQNVAYSENFSANLISVGQLTKSGFGVTFSDDEAIIVPPENNEIQLVAPQLDGLYVLKQTILNKNKDDHMNHQALVVYRDPDVHASNIKEILLLHERTGHLNAQALAKLISNNAVSGINNINITELNNIIKLQCDYCALSKAHREKFSIKSKQPIATETMFRIHCDITGPLESSDDIMDGTISSRYYSIISDEYSGMIFGQAIPDKAQTSKHIVNEINRLENLTNKKLKYFHSDGGGEYNSDELIQYLLDKGITKTSTTRNTPQHNGIPERAIRTIFESARTMSARSKLPLLYWTYAVDAAVYLYNRRTIKYDGKTPYELFYGNKPTMSYLKVFGCDAFILNHQEYVKKLDNKSIKGVMLGYDEREKVYNILNIQTRKVIRSRDVQFHEDRFNHVDDLTVTLMENYDNIYNSDEDYARLAYERFRKEEEVMNELLSQTSVQDKKNQMTESEIKQELRTDSEAHQEVLVNEPDEVDSISDNALANINNNNSSTNTISSSSNTSSNKPRLINSSNIFKNYDIDNPIEREQFTRTYIKPHYSKHTVDKKSMKDLIGTQPNGNIKWANLHNDRELFNKVSEQFFPNDYKEVTLQSSNNPESREIRNPNPLAMVNYDNPRELSTGGQNMYALNVQMNGNNIKDNSHESIELMIDHGNPINYKEAISSSDQDKWLNAMKEEINQIIDNKTYTLMSLPSNSKAIPCKWVYKIKHDMNGNISKYKARLVVKGFHQREGRDYDETFAPVKYPSLRILLAIATIFDLEIKQFDVDSA